MFIGAENALSFSRSRDAEVDGIAAFAGVVVHRTVVAGAVIQRHRAPVIAAQFQSAPGVQALGGKDLDQHDRADAAASVSARLEQRRTVGLPPAPKQMLTVAV